MEINMKQLYALDLTCSRTSTGLQGLVIESPSWTVYAEKANVVGEDEVIKQVRDHAELVIITLLAG